MPVSKGDHLPEVCGSNSRLGQDTTGTGSVPFNRSHPGMSVAVSDVEAELKAVRTFNRSHPGMSVAVVLVVTPTTITTWVAKLPCGSYAIAKGGS